MALQATGRIASLAVCCEPRENCSRPPWACRWRWEGRPAFRVSLALQTGSGRSSERACPTDIGTPRTLVRGQIMTGVKHLKLNSKIRWSKATALLTVAVALLIGMGAAPAMANSPLTTTSSCFTGGCHGYADFAAWHNYHRTTMAIACSTCHTAAPAVKSTADACDGCHSGEVAKHSTRSAGCSTCH